MENNENLEINTALTETIVLGGKVSFSRLLSQYSEAELEIIKQRNNSKFGEKPHTTITLTDLILPESMSPIVEELFEKKIFENKDGKPAIGFKNKTRNLPGQFWKKDSETPAEYFTFENELATGVDVLVAVRVYETGNDNSPYNFSLSSVCVVGEVRYFKPFDDISLF